ncbi:MAG: hypothetical protein ACRD3N_17300 [Terracidiphilus sp.]
MSAAAQTTVTTSGTTSSGTVPVFNGTATVTNSPISVSGSNVGIDPQNGVSPSSPLTVGNPNSNLSGAPTAVYGTNPSTTPTIFEFMGADCTELAGSVSPSGSYPFWLQARTCDNNTSQLLLNPAGGDVGIGSSTGTATVNGALVVSGTTGFTPNFTATSGSSFGVKVVATAIPSGSSSADYSGGAITASTLSGNAQNFTGGFAGVSGQAYHKGTGTVAWEEGTGGSIYNLSSGTITKAYGIYGQVNNSSTGTIATGYGAYIDTPTNSGGGHFSKYYGVYIAQPTVATTNYSLYSAGGTNYFGGSVGIGTTSPGSGYKLDVEGGSVNSSGGYCIGGSCIGSWPTATANTWTGTQTFSGNILTSGNVVPGGDGVIRSIVPIAMFGGEALINSTSWQTVTRTTYTSIANLFAGTTILPGATRQYYLIIRRADNQPGGNGSNWRFSCAASWNSGVNVPGHGFTLASDYGSPDEGTTDWVQVPASAVSSGCSTPYWEVDAQMVNAGPVMRVMSVSMAAVDVYGGTNTGYSQASSGNATSPPMSALYDSVWATGLGGNVGIGTTSPQYTLDVAGQIHTSGGIVFPDGSTQSAAYTGINCGGDYAESVDVTGDRKKFEPGDILVIDPDHPGKFLKSAEPYSTSVTGIYSTKPGTVGRRQTGPKNPDEVPMAMLGIVPTKVSAENGAIKPGDLLVTSSKIGYAMKGTDRSRMLGAVVGKALGSLDSGTGVIEVVVTLQ